MNRESSLLSIEVQMGDRIELRSTRPGNEPLRRNTGIHFIHMPGTIAMRDHAAKWHAVIKGILTFLGIARD
jgi:hypothetical protein